MNKANRVIFPEQLRFDVVDENSHDDPFRMLSSLSANLFCGTMNSILKNVL